MPRIHQTARRITGGIPKSGKPQGKTTKVKKPEAPPVRKGRRKTPGRTPSKNTYPTKWAYPQSSLNSMRKIRAFTEYQWRQAYRDWKEDVAYYGIDDNEIFNKYFYVQKRAMELNQERIAAEKEKARLAEESKTMTAERLAELKEEKVEEGLRELEAEFEDERLALKKRHRYVFLFVRVLLCEGCSVT